MVLTLKALVRYLTSSLLIGWLSTGAVAEPLNVVTENWPPYNYQSPSGEIDGIATDSVKAILELTDLSYQIRVNPWARSLHLAKTEPNTLIYSIYRSAEREPYFHWFCPILANTPIYLYRLASNNVKFSSLADILDNKLRIGVMREDNSHQFLRSMGFVEGVHLDISTAESLNFNKLFAGRIDFIVQSEASMVYRLEQLGQPLSVVSKVSRIHPSEQSTHCMALSKASSSEVVGEIKRAFVRWQQENPLSEHSLADVLSKLPES